MIFGFRMADKVLAGEKIETRRVGRGDKPCRYVRGRSYAVQRGRGMLSEGRIKIVSVRRERLGDVTRADAVREGFDTVIEFFAYWRELHGEVDPEQRVWVIRFKLEEPRPQRSRLIELEALGAGVL